MVGRVVGALVVLVGWDIAWFTVFCAGFTIDWIACNIASASSSSDTGAANADGANSEITNKTVSASRNFMTFETWSLGIILSLEAAVFQDFNNSWVAFYKSSRVQLCKGWMQWGVSEPFCVYSVYPSILNNSTIGTSPSFTPFVWLKLCTCDWHYLKVWNCDWQRLFTHSRSAWEWVSVCQFARGLQYIRVGMWISLTRLCYLKFLLT